MLKICWKKVQIFKYDKKVRYHSRKLLLFDKRNMWLRKGRHFFDVAMGAYDGVEVCKLVGTFLTEKISKTCNKIEMGLSRDDSLSFFKNKSDTQLEK